MIQTTAGQKNDKMSTLSAKCVKEIGKIESSGRSPMIARVAKFYNLQLAN